MILWPLVALVTVLLVVGAVRYGQPALEHRRHARTLANIARLEIELGVGEPPVLSPQVLWQPGGTWMPISAPPPVEAGVWNLCDHCRYRVRLDKGHCQVAADDRWRCARYLYQHNES